jgi:hypothetical protein
MADWLKIILEDELGEKRADAEAATPAFWRGHDARIRNKPPIRAAEDLQRGK